MTATSVSDGGASVPGPRKDVAAVTPPATGEDAVSAVPLSDSAKEDVVPGVNQQGQEQSSPIDTDGSRQVSPDSGATASAALAPTSAQGQDVDPAVDLGKDDPQLLPFESGKDRHESDEAGPAPASRPNGFRDAPADGRLGVVQQGLGRTGDPEVPARAIAQSVSRAIAQGSADPTTEQPPGQGPGPLETVDELREESKQIAISLQQAALGSMKRNLAINTIARAAFYLGAALLLAVVAYYLAVRFDAFVQAVLDARGEGGPDFNQTLIGIATPIVLGVVGSGVFVAIASLIQSRSGSEAAKALAQVSRLVRESPSVTGRSHALTQVLEETLANARQAFTIQLWISRVLFGTGITLLFVFVGSLFFGDALASGGAAATSLLAFVASALLNPQRQIRSDLATVTQLAAILASYTRQAGVIEEYLYQVLQQHKRAGAADGAQSSVMEGVDKLGRVLKSAMDNVGEYVHAPEQINPREVWLWQQLSLRRDEAKVDSGK